MQEQSLEGYRLSPQQRHLWLLQQGDYSAAYSTVCVVRVRGPLNLGGWESAVESVIQRQEILRTKFRLLPGMMTPLQVIGEAEPWSSEQEDVSGQSEAEQEQSIEQAYVAAGRQEWQVGAGPLVRIKLLRLGVEQHAIVISMPALCSDSVGMSNLVRQIAHAYDAQLTGASPSSELMQYADVSDILNELLESVETAAGRDFWLNSDLHSGSSFELGSKRHAVGGAPFVPDKICHQLPAPTVLEIDSISTLEGKSVAAFLLACWQVLLWRLSGLPRLVVGTAMAGRSYPELEAALGLYTRYLPLSQPLSGELSFREVQQSAARQLSEAYEWQEYFSWEESGIGAGNGAVGRATPYCALAFGYEELPESMAAGELQFTIERLSSCAERYEVKLQCQRRGPGLELEWHYDGGRLSARAVARLAQQYATLVASACQRPEATLAELAVVSEGEREELVVAWNRTERQYADASLPELFEAQVERSPAALAVQYEGARLSYAELDKRANQVAHYLQGQGIGAEAVVGILLERSLELVVCLLGVLKAGAAYLPLDASYPEARLRYMLADGGVQLLLTEEWLLERVGAVECGVLCVSKEAAQLGQQSEARPERRLSSENLAYVIYTSGSSGRPKGVMITHRALSNHMQWLEESYPLRREDRVLQKTACSFDASVWEFYAPLLAGAGLVLARPGGHQDSKYLVGLMREQEISIVQVVPSMLRLLLAEAGLESCARLRRVFSGGERLTAELAGQFWERLAGVELINLYGPTEATIDATHRRYAAGEQWEGIGRPVGNMKCYLLDEKLKVVPVGAVGEIWLGGAGLARGYVKGPALTAQKFVPDQYSGAVGARLYGTGDLARYDSVGELEYEGRADGQLKVRGYRIEVGEIEQRLRQHAEVQEAVVVGQGAVGRVERLVGYVVLAPGSELQVEELRRHVEQELPDYMVPSSWVKLERLPLTVSGKVDRLALPEPDNTRSNLKERYVAPQTEAERIIDTIWQGVLQVEKIGINDNFFDLGGHSLLMLQVHHQLDEAFERDVSIIDMFQYPTISSLATFLSRNGSEDSFIYDNQDRAENRKESRKRQKEIRQEVRATIYQQQASGK